MAHALKSMDGRVGELSRARPKDTSRISNETLLATGTIGYLLVMLAVVAWQLFDIWIGAYSFPAWLGYDRTRLDTPGFHLVAYTVIGGALGSVVNGLRSFLIHHHKFAGRYVWKYIVAPWMGAALALLVYALIHSSTAVFAGSGGATSGSVQGLANFAAGALAGYGAKDVFIWLDVQVQKLFKAEQPTPDVEGQAQATAAATLHAHNQAVGNVSTVTEDTGTQPGTVVAQTPSPGSPIPRGDEVSLAVQGDVTDGDDPRADRS